MNIFSYVVRSDTGFAPNPYGGVCTLVTCKPHIRKCNELELGDWIVGLASLSVKYFNDHPRVVYAMKVTEIMPLKEYDRHCKKHLKIKIPIKTLKGQEKKYEESVGDCIYDYSNCEKPKLRQSLHSEKNRKNDLAGENALLSRHFYYFGTKAVKLPQCLSALDLSNPKSRQGQKRNSGVKLVMDFEKWIKKLEIAWGKNSICGKPINARRKFKNGCGTC